MPKSNNLFCGLCALLLAAALTVTCVADAVSAGAQVRGDILRLHVIADSDAPEAQEVKLKVRDALLEQAAALCGSPADAAEAAELIAPRLEEITGIAEGVLRENGFDYGARAALVREYFDERAYGEFTLPAGTYTALKVTLGSGSGQNWWCVMFPPLCLPAAAGGTSPADIFTDRERRVVAPAEGYRVRLKLAELLGAWLERLRGE